MVLKGFYTMGKKGIIAKIQELHAAWLLVAAIFGGGSIGGAVVFGQKAIYWVVEDSVKTEINDTIVQVKKELDQQRHNDMVAISELLMALPEVREKAESMRTKKKASNAVLEALENGN